MKLFRLLFAGVFVLGLTMYAVNMIRHAELVAKIDSSPAPAKTWQEVGRKVMIDQEWDMSQATMWRVGGVPNAPQDIRLWLDGSFQASESGVRVIVGKMSGGASPDSVSSGPYFHLPVSAEGYAFGFFPPPQQRSSLDGIPTSALGLAVTALKLYQETHPAPIHVRARVCLIVESLCWPSECLAERRVWSDTLQSK